MSVYYKKMRNKILLICGNFYIELIKRDIDNDTNKCVVYSYTQDPLITIPTRITNSSSITALDNSFYKYFRC